MSEGERRAPTVLLTGLRGSGEFAADPSSEILALLGADPPRAAACRTLLLPDGPDDALLKAVETMDHFLPDAVLILGLGDGQGSLSVDRVAVNGPGLEGGGAPLSPGPAVFADPVDAAGPAGYISTLPVEAIVARMRAAGVPARAGAAGANPMCNRLHYALLHYVALRGGETWFKRLPPSGLVSRIGSITLPPTPQMVAGGGPQLPALPIETTLRGVLHAIDAVADFLAAASEETVQPRPAHD